MATVQGRISDYGASIQTCYQDLSHAVSESNLSKTLQKHKDVIIVSMQLAIDLYSFNTEPVIFSASLVTSLVKPDFFGSIFTKVNETWVNYPNCRQLLSAASLSAFICFPSETQAICSGIFTAKLIQGTQSEPGQTSLWDKLPGLPWPFSKVKEN